MEIGNTDLDQYSVPYSSERYSTLNDYLIDFQEFIYIKYLHEWYTTIHEYVRKFEEIIFIRHVNFKATVFEYIMQSYVRFFTNGSQFSSGQLLVTDFSARVFFKDCYVGLWERPIFSHGLTHCTAHSTLHHTITFPTPL